LEQEKKIEASHGKQKSGKEKKKRQATFKVSKKLTGWGRVKTKEKGIKEDIGGYIAERGSLIKEYGKGPGGYREKNRRNRVHKIRGTGGVRVFSQAGREIRGSHARRLKEKGSAQAK